MNESITRENSNKAKLAVALSAMIHDLSILYKLVEELKKNGKEVNLANLLDMFYKEAKELEVKRAELSERMRSNRDPSNRNWLIYSYHKVVLSLELCKGLSGR